MSEENKLKQILAERSEYGDFAAIAMMTQHFDDMVRRNNVGEMTAAQREAIHMIFHKIARATCGNANKEDHWRDIAGYATLVADKLAKD